MRIVYFTLGKGSGHIVGAASLYYAFRRKGIDPEFFVLTDCEFAHILEPVITYYHISPQSGLVLTEPRQTELYTYLKELMPDILVVDGLWLPLHLILDDFKFKKVFIIRKVPDWWLVLDHPRLGRYEFTPGQYDLVASNEPNFEIKGGININPMIIRNRDEILPADEAKKKLGAETGKKLCIIGHNGYENEMDELLKIASEYKKSHMIKILSNEEKNSFFPLADYMNGIDLLIGGTGMMVFYEAKFFNVKSIHMPFKRTGDDQFWRAQTNKDFHFNINGADQLAFRILDL